MLFEQRARSVETITATYRRTLMRNRQFSIRPSATDRGLQGLSAFARDEKVARLAGEDLTHHRQEGLERLRRVRGIKGELVPPLAESYARSEVRTRPVMVPEPAVLFQVMKVVVALKDVMVLDDPPVLLAHVGAQDRRSQFCVILWRQHVADVVQQGSDNSFGVGSIA